MIKEEGGGIKNPLIEFNLYLSIDLHPLSYRSHQLFTLFQRRRSNMKEEKNWQYHGINSC